MSSESFDTWELGQLWTNVMPLLILATMAASLLVLSPWGIDLPYSPLSHFFTLFPLVVLATITYITKRKLDDEEAEVPSS